MGLGSLPEVKSLLSIASDNQSQDTPLTQALLAAEAAVESYCKRRFALATSDRYPTSTGTPELLLDETPVRCYRLSASALALATTITGLSDTDSLAVGMPVVHDDIPVGTTIATIAGATSVTISAAVAAAIAAESVLFGLEVWLDSNGRFGDGEDAFNDTTRLTLGADYELERDLFDGCSSSGIIRRLGGGGASIAQSLWNDPWMPVSYGGGTLTARRAPCWPEGRGNVKTRLTSGYAPGNVPEDLKSAIHQTAIWLWRYAPTAGLVMGSENKSNSAGGYGYSLMALTNAIELASVRGILRNYRRVII